MTDDRLTRNLKILSLVLLSLALATVVYLFLSRVKLVVVILIGATFFAYLIYPAVSWLQQRRFPRWAAIATVYLALALIIGTGLAFAGPVVGDQARNLTQDFPTLVGETRDSIVNAMSPSDQASRLAPRSISDDGSGTAALRSTRPDHDATLATLSCL